MIRTGLWSRFIKLQMPFPFPGPAFVIGDLHGKAVPSALGVVADEHPMAAAQRSDLGAGPRVGKVAIGHFAPRFAAIMGFTLMQALGRWTVVAHERVKRSILAVDNAGLDVAGAGQRRAGVPALAPV